VLLADTGKQWEDYMRKVLVAGVLALLVLPTAASAYSVHRYRVRDAGSQIRHSLTICKDRYDVVHRFELASRVETANGADRRIRYSRYTVRRGCRRLVQWYPGVLRYGGWYCGRVKVRLLQTDDIQYTRWRRFRSE
jgi:hypothetical protein